MSSYSTSVQETPARLAYIASIVFTLASAATNFVYGWNKGGDIPSSLIWATVSVGVSIVFALSWPAFMRAADQKQNARAFVLLLGLLLTGSYSVSAALGSAYGSRVQAASVETDKSDARAKSQAAYKAAKVELDRLAPARPASELEPQIRSLKATKGANGCDRRDGPVSRDVCAKADALEAEAARASRREALAAAMDKATDELGKIGTVTVANTDAVAIADFLAAAGITIGAERVNKILVLLAVLVIECGGGVSLCIAMSLQSSVSSVPQGVPDTSTVPRTRTLRTAMDTDVGQAEKAESLQEAKCPTAADTQPGTPPDTAPQNPASVRLLAMLREKGGVLAGGQRSMAQSLGWSKSRLNAVLHELAATKAIKLTTGRTGTVIQLAPAFA